MKEMKFKKILGVDIGGSGIKGAPVHTKKGILKKERHRILTPDPATPEAVAGVIKELVDHFSWKGPVGCGFPAVIQKGVAKTAANVDKSWIGTNVDELFTKVSGCPTFVVNDADAAGMAEVKFGAGRDCDGTILLITIGTGLGTVLFSKGKLVKNTELGHIILNGQDAEKYASDAARKNFNLSWEEWAGRFNEYLLYMESLFWPELIIIGGGASKKEKKFFQYLTVQAEVKPAELLNNAGIVGAALYAKTFKNTL
jgi:polyphosphate glucokinase